MNKDEYLDLLELYLQDLPYEEVQEILLDYKEHFHIGISKGKSEEEIAKELGSPKDIAANFTSTSIINNSHFETNSKQNSDTISSNDPVRRLIIGIALIFFNLIVVLGPFIGALGLLFGLYASVFSFIIVGTSFIFLLPITPILSNLKLHFLTSFSFGLGFIGLGILGILLSIYLTKLFYKLIIRYLNWNVDLINK